MPLQATSGAASYDGFGGGVPVAANYIEDVFSTWLYTGNGSTQTITNGIDLSGKGGMLWLKRRDAAFDPRIWDTARGRAHSVATDLTDAQTTDSAGNGVTSFNSDGFSLGPAQNTAPNINTASMVSWTFRKQPKFFDVVTYTGNATAGRTVAHNLGSVPGCIIVKRTDASNNWIVYHRSLANTQALVLDSTSAALSVSVWNDTTPTSTVFTVGAASETNGNGATYVAYLFAHNAGGFGLTGTDNVVSCGSFTTDGSGVATVNLGYEPQWLLFKFNSNDSWKVFDNMRGMSQTNWNELNPNTTGAEVARTNQSDLNIRPSATGFTITWSPQASRDCIYIAIRRGPMKTPTTGTSVFSPTTASSEPQSTPLLTGGSFPSDMVLHRPRYTLTSYGFYNTSRLTGNRSVLATFNTNAETDFGANYWRFDNSTAAYIPANGYFNNNGEGNIGYALYSFRRAPSFFDVVCYTGTGSATTVAHNLGVVPELILVKRRDATFAGRVYSATLGNTKFLQLFSATGNAAEANTGAGSNGEWNATTPTSSVFSVGAVSATNGSGFTFVAYLFASCPGVSKVGSYTGTGALQTINCGFTGGARFVLIKRTDSTGDWYVYDSARGITSGNDPYSLLNSTAAEVTGTNYVDTTSVGFQVTAAAPAGLNANGGTYIFLAIA